MGTPPPTRRELVTDDDEYDNARLQQLLAALREANCAGSRAQLEDDDE